jgi:hypothetical protein
MKKPCQSNGNLRDSSRFLGAAKCLGGKAGALFWKDWSQQT